VFTGEQLFWCEVVWRPSRWPELASSLADGPFPLTLASGPVGREEGRVE
jgi:hypothetical protein